MSLFKCGGRASVNVILGCERRTPQRLQGAEYGELLYGACFKSSGDDNIFCRTLFLQGVTGVCESSPLCVTCLTWQSLGGSWN